MVMDQRRAERAGRVHRRAGDFARARMSNATVSPMPKPPSFIAAARSSTAVPKMAVINRNVRMNSVPSRIGTVTQSRGQRNAKLGGVDRLPGRCSCSGRGQRGPDQLGDDVQHGERRGCGPRKKAERDGRIEMSPADAGEDAHGNRQGQAMGQRDADQAGAAADRASVETIAAMPAKHRKNVPIASAKSCLTVFIGLLPPVRTRSGGHGPAISIADGLCSAATTCSKLPATSTARATLRAPRRSRARWSLR